MTTTITYAGGPNLVPTLALAATARLSSKSRTVSHEILDGAPVHTLRPATPATGTLRLLFDTETGARDCWTAHQLASVFVVQSDDSALVNFRYIVTDDNIDIELDDESQELWTVNVPIQVVP